MGTNTIDMDNPLRRNRSPPRRGQGGAAKKAKPHEESRSDQEASWQTAAERSNEKADVIAIVVGQRLAEIIAVTK